MPSILGALSADCPASLGVTGATDGDIAFLKALYDTDPKSFDFLQRSSIAEAMQRDAKAR
jgi:hypothetical protein